MSYAYSYLDSPYYYSRAFDYPYYSYPSYSRYYSPYYDLPSYRYSASYLSPYYRSVYDYPSPAYSYSRYYDWPYYSRYSSAYYPYPHTAGIIHLTCQRPNPSPTRLWRERPCTVHTPVPEPTLPCCESSDSAFLMTYDGLHLADATVELSSVSEPNLRSLLISASATYWDQECCIPSTRHSL